jgi:hypothetical protein
MEGRAKKRIHKGLVVSRGWLGKLPSAIALADTRGDGALWMVLALVCGFREWSGDDFVECRDLAVGLCLP